MVEVVEAVDDDDDDDDDDDVEFAAASLVDSSISLLAVSIPDCVKRNTHPVAGHNFFRCCWTTRGVPLVPLFSVASCDQ